MDGQSDAVFWTLLGLAVLALLAGAVLRPAVGGRGVLVVRGGVVRREVWRGLAVGLWPWDRFVGVDADPDPLLLAVPATTGDHRDVRLLVEAAWRPAPYPSGTSYDDPAAALERALGERLRETVGWLGVRELPDGLTGHLAELRAGVRVPGAELADLELAEVEILLRPSTAPGAGCDAAG